MSRAWLIAALLWTACAPAPNAPVPTATIQPDPASEPPTSYRALIDRAEAEVSRGALDEAERSFSEARELAPERIEARYGLAFVMSRRCWDQERDCQACLDAFNAILAKGAYRHAHYNRAQCAFELGHRDAALADLDRAVEASPDDLDYRMTRALMLLSLGRTGEACEDLHHAAKLGGDVRALLGARCSD
jgi:tetratricopeptide (TPR) repeat protein